MSKNKKHNRELQYEPKKPEGSEAMTNPNDVRDELKIDESVRPLCVALHLSRLEGAAEAHVMKGILNEVQEKILMCLDKVDANNSLLIMVGTQPVDICLAAEKECNENLKKQNNELSNDNSGSQSNGSGELCGGVAQTCEEGDGAEGSVETNPSTDLNPNELSKDPFENVQP